MEILIYVCGALSILTALIMIWHLIQDQWDRATFYLVVTVWMWYIVTII